jgi:hypothetical protein
MVLCTLRCVLCRVCAWNGMLGPGTHRAWGGWPEADGRACALCVRPAGGPAREAAEGLRWALREAWHRPKCVVPHAQCALCVCAPA